MSTDELDMVETDAMVDAIHRRLGPRGALVLATLSDRSDEEEGKQVWFRGGGMTALGLVVYAKQTLLNIAPRRLEDGTD